MPGKSTRRIVVDGARYRWRHRARMTSAQRAMPWGGPLTCTIEPESAPGRLLGDIFGDRRPQDYCCAHCAHEKGIEAVLHCAARSLVAALRTVERRLVPVLDAVLGWVATESRRFRPHAPEPPMALRWRAVDVWLVVLATAPLAALHIDGTPGVDGLMFPDGTLQVTATVEGPAGPEGPPGPEGPAAEV